MEQYYIIDCEARFRGRIHISKPRYDTLSEALQEAGKAADQYISTATAYELSWNENKMLYMKIKRVFEQNGRICGMCTVGCVFLY